MNDDLYALKSPTGKILAIGISHWHRIELAELGTAQKYADLLAMGYEEVRVKPVYGIVGYEEVTP